MEIWDLYNEKRSKIKTNHQRGEKIEDGLYHLVVHVWIRNSHGEYLISQRSQSRPTFPLMWECVGGSVIKGEDSLQGALRETIEEVGIDLSNSFGKVVETVTRKDFHDIMDVWLFEYNGDVMLETATTDEVMDVKWMKKDQIKSLYEQGKFVPTLFYFFNLFK